MRTSLFKPALFLAFLLAASLSVSAQNSAIQLDGADDYLEAADILAIEPVGAVTVEAWVKLNSTPTSFTSVVAKWNPDATVPERSYSLFIDTQNTPVMAISGDGAAVATASSEEKMEIGVWHHLAGVYDGTTIKIYLDGILVGEQTSAVPASIYYGTETVPLTLGFTSNTAEIGTGGLGEGDNTLPIDFDEVRIWGKAKTDAEVLSQLSNALTGSETDLLAYYNFESGTGTTAVDLTSNANNAAFYNDIGNTIPADGSTVGPLWVTSGAFDVTERLYQVTGASTSGFFMNYFPIAAADAISIDIDDNSDFSSPLATNVSLPNQSSGSSFVSQALSNNTKYYVKTFYDSSGVITELPGTIEFMVSPGNSLPFTTNHFVSVPDNSLLEPAGAFTIEFWLKTTATGNRIILEKNSNNTEYSVQHFTTGEVGLNINGGFLRTNGNNFNDGTWHHFAIVYRGANDGSIYVDGIEDTEASPTVGVPTFGNGALTIGNRLGGSSTISIGGELDEIRIWDRERTPTEIQGNRYKNLTGKEDGLTAYYRFDEETGTVLPDLSSNMLDGTLTNMTGSEWTASGAFSSFTVTNTNDSGPGSLRKAITDANSSTLEPVNIVFDLPAPGPWIINLVTPLPDLSRGMKIDARSQIGYNFSSGEMIVLDGATNSVSYGFRTEYSGVSGDNLLISGFKFTGFTNAGIAYTNSLNEWGNYLIEDNVFGNLSLSSIQSAINVSNAQNVIIRNNIIGLDFDGVSPAPITGNGVNVTFTVANTVIENNTLANIDYDGIYRDRGLGADTLVNNTIGLSSARTALAETQLIRNGIVLSRASDVLVANNYIAGTGDKNLGAAAISMNTGNDRIYIENNTLGEAIDQTPVTNREGISIVSNSLGYTDIHIGGESSQGNKIVNSSEEAIRVVDSSVSGVFIRANSISNNGAGIVLNGANGGILPPVIQNLEYNDLSGTGADGNMIHLYAGDGNGQGQTILDSVIVASGSWSFDPGLYGIQPGDQVVLTQTGISGTSEFADTSINTFDNGLAFDGTDYVRVVDDPLIQFGTGDFTIEAWFYFNGTVTDRVLVGKRNANSPFQQIQLRMGQGLNNGAGPKVEAYILPDNRAVSGNDPSPEDRIVTSADDLTVGWHHLAMVQDYDVDLKLYLDGVLIGSNSNDHLGKTVNIAGQDLFLGGVSSVPGFTGTLDEVRIWNAARPQDSIQKYIQNPLFEDETNLIAYYDFNQGIPGGDNTGISVLEDRSANQLDGSLINFSLQNDNNVSNFVLSSALDTSPAGTALIVTNTNNLGPGSLREAVNYANLHPGADTIVFNLSGGGPWTIDLATGLTVSDDTTYFDGSSQPGWDFGSGNMVTVAGPGAGIGIDITANNVRVRGLRMTGWARPIWASESNPGIVENLQIDQNILVGNTNTAIYLQYANFSRIEGNMIGVEADSVTLNSNSRNGIEIAAGRKVQITGNISGGATASNYGIRLVSGDSISIKGNFIGTTVTGLSIPNGGGGIEVAAGATNTIIGGPNPGDRNIISGNSGSFADGIFLVADAHIENNFIGVSPDGLSAMPNGQSGIESIRGGSIINNVIAGNGAAEVLIRDNSNALLIDGNFIGTDSTGANPIVSAGDGIYMRDGVNRTITNNIIAGSSNGWGLETAFQFDNNIIQGNYFGTDVTGTINMGNAAGAIHLDYYPDNNVIGGNIDGQQNIIAFNNGPAIQFQARSSSQVGKNNYILNNQIYSNASGIVFIDNASYDLKINGGVEPPIITSVSAAEISGRVQGDLSGKDPAIQIHVYLKDTASGQGMVLVDSLNTTGDEWTLTGTFATDTNYVATVTVDTMGTSQFSIPVNASIVPVNGPSALILTEPGPGQVDLSWVDNDTDEAGFIIERSSDKNNWQTLTGLSENTTSYSDLTAVDSVYYFYRVSSYNGGGIASVSATSAISKVPQPGTALAFDGADDFVNLPDDPALDFGSGDFTVEYWVKKNASASNWSNVYGVSKWNSAGGNPGGNEWALQIGSNQNDDNPSFSIESGSTQYGVISSDPINIGQWYHIAGVKKGDELTIYINGDPKGSVTGVPLSVNNAGRVLTIARNDLSNFFYSNADFDEVRIWNKAIGLDTLRNYIYQTVDVGHPDYSNLVTYFSFDEGTGSSLLNLATASDGSLSGTMDPNTDWIASGAMTPANSTDVLNTLDNGVGSLRAAIDFANANSGPDTIRFKLPGEGPWSIVPQTLLPTLQDDSTVIDGTTQPGWDFASGSIVTIDGQNFANNNTNNDGIIASSSANNLEIYGLRFINWNEAVNIASNYAVVGDTLRSNVFINSYKGVYISGDFGLINYNHFGVDTDTTSIGLNLEQEAILAFLATGTKIYNNVVGGVNDPYAIFLNGGANGDLKGNFIGVSPSGTSISNSSTGIRPTADFTIIGGPNKADRNYIAGNSVSGIAAVGNDVIIQNNYIGLDSAGNVLGNGFSGVSVSNRSNVSILNNVITGNGNKGINLTSNANNITVSGNLIGLTPDTLSAPGNGSASNAIHVNTGFAPIITNNYIGGNGYWGIRLYFDSHNANIEGNVIGTGLTGTEDFGNGSGGIYLGDRPYQDTVGGNQVDKENIIAFNKGPAIELQLSSGTSITPWENFILGNKIYANDQGIVFTDANGTHDINKGILPPIITSLSTAEIGGSLQGNLAGYTGDAQLHIYEADTSTDTQGISLLSILDISGTDTWTFSGSLQEGKAYTATVSVDTMGTSQYAVRDTIPESVPPTVTINQASVQTDPTNGDVVFDVVFSEPVSGFDPVDVDLSSSTAPGTLAVTITEVAPNNGTTYTATVTGMTGDGDVIAKIPAGVAEDIFGNLNDPSTSTDNIVFVDLKAPTISGPATPSIAENSTTVGTYTGDEPLQDMGFSGTDGSFFLIEPSTGNFFFADAPDFENPQDANGDNIYEVVIEGQDLAGNIGTLAVSVTVTDVNENSVTVTAPNGGESLTAGSPYEVSWTDNAAASDLIEIRLSTDGGTTFGIIADGTFDMFNGVYSWTVPNTPGIENLIEIANTTAGVSDVSDAPFSISSAPSVTVTAPNGGESLAAGSSYEISWTDNAAASDLIEIRLSTDGGTTFGLIADGTFDMFNGVYSWTVPNTPGIENLIEIANTTAGISDVSDAPFSISSAPSVTVTAPNGGETLNSGEVYNITWTDNALATDNIELAYSSDGVTFNVITTNTADVLNGTYAWTVPNESGSTYEISVTNSSEFISDRSDAPFTIVDVTAPTISGPANPSVPENSTTVGTYTGDEPLQDMGFSGTDGSFFLIEPSTGNFFFANAPDFENPQDANGDNIYEVVIEGQDLAGNIGTLAVSVAVTDVNENSVTVTSPNGGEVLSPGSTFNVTWTENFTGSDLIEIRHSTDGGASSSIVADGTFDTFNGSYPWTVPSTLGTNNLIIISNTTVGVGDTSDAAFEITSSPAITLTAPNGGETLNSGEVYNITWTDNALATDNIELAYSSDGVTFNVITTNTADVLNGTYAWTVPNESGSTYEVSVTNATETISDQSDAPFTIVDVTAPTISGPANPSVPENSTTVGTYIGDEPLQDMGFSGTDGSFFLIEPSTGNFFFANAPDFENPQDANGDNIYEVVIEGQDLAGNTGTLAVSVAVTDVDDINREITLLTPNGGENLAVDSTITITWSGQYESSDTVLAEYSADNGSTFTQISQATAGSLAEALSWTVPNNPGADNLIRLSILSTSVNDVSDGTFTIFVPDNTAPIVTVDALETQDNTPDLNGTVDDPTATIRVSVGTQTLNASNNGDGTWVVDGGVVEFLSVGTYDISVQATDLSGNIGSDDTNNELTILPVAVEAIAATDVSPLSFRANWTGGVDVADYRLDVSQTADFTSLLSGYDDLSVTETSILITGLDYNQTYFYRVRTNYNAGVSSGNSNVIEVRTPEDPGTAPDSLALVAIYNATQGETWTNSTNWLTGRLRTWYGVTFDGTRVTEIDLSSNGLSGGLPELLQGLENVTLIDISDNELTEVNSLSSLSSLARAIISGNRFDFADMLAWQLPGVDLSASPQKSLLAPVNTVQEIGTSYVVDRTVNGAESYNWTRNGAAISGESGPTITVDIESFADEATYVAIASSSAFPTIQLSTEPVQLKVSSLERDSVSLRIVYDSLTQAGGSSLSDWTSLPISDWEEVQTPNNRVTEVDLSDKGLSGRLPESILDIKTITRLDLSGNEISGIPDFSGQLPDLSLILTDNKLDFGDLENILSFEGTVENTEQKPFGDSTYVQVDEGLSYTIDVFSPGGSANSYFWRVDGVLVPASNTEQLLVEPVDFESMGDYRLFVEDSQDRFGGLQLESETFALRAQADIEVVPVYLDGDEERTLADGDVGAELFEIPGNGGPYRKTDTTILSATTVLFEDVVLGDYLVYLRSDPERELGETNTQLLSTYFGGSIDWVEAEPILLRSNFLDTTRMEAEPADLPPIEGGGILNMSVIADLPEGSGESRVEARRRVRKASCSLRRASRGGGGRTDQDDEDYVLIAVKETDEEGNVSFGDLPSGAYRINIQYPGVPMDETSNIDFIIEEGEEGAEFTANALITEDGISIELEKILGIIRNYFKDLVIYPNPSDKFFTLKYKRLLSETVSMRMVSLGGDVLQEVKVDRGYDQSLEVETDEIAEGIYLLYFYDQESTKEPILTYKIIVRH